ncbi:MAG: glycosyltransferase [Oscillospiraceae bacterium]|nr:glycosyltransferase [Oscillospiraceae bacterium]
MMARENSKIKLIVVGLSLYNGGAEKSLVNFLNALDYSRYDVDLLLIRKNGMFLDQVPREVEILETPASLKYCYNKIDKKAFKSFDGVKSAIIRAVGTMSMSLKKESAYWKRQYRWKHFYKRTIKDLEGSYDVAMGYLHGEVSWYVIDKIKAKRKILWVHNDYNSLFSDIEEETRYFSKADCVVSISDRCVEILKEFFPKLNEKFSVLPNITSESLIRKMAAENAPDEFQSFQKIPYLVSIGRLSEQKGFDIAVEAAAILKERGEKFQWLIIGDGELKNDLERQIKERKVEGIVKLIGVRSNPYVYIKNCTVFVQSSRFEGKSVVLDEAKILGKPIVVTDYATVRDQIVNEDEGMIVDITPKALADGIEIMLNNEALRNEFSQYLSTHMYDNSDAIKLYYNLMETGL